MFISDDPNWAVKAIKALYVDNFYKQVQDFNGLILLPLPTKNNIVNVGYTFYDAPGNNTLQNVYYPFVKFLIKYPNLDITHIELESTKEGISNSYDKIFEHPINFPNYYLQTHRSQEHLEEYYYCISELLAHQWMENTSSTAVDIVEIKRVIQIIKSYFKSAPIELRNYYIQEGHEFLDWIMRYL
ncbi:hypothetical protein [Spirosoma spitsbergense]|uniref:hypothetical protein n=1 Tax=Spirosoma spitsbergense TaxID=431554 RepID=UPI00036E7C46|nr:hypothetical protein [Spirosoma spitsbergense]